MKRIDKVSVIGLGKLGAPMAACMAAAGYTVVAADLDDRKVAAVNAGRAPVNETDLPEMIQRAGDRLSATTDVSDAVAQTEATFVIVPTPSQPDGRFSCEYVRKAAASIGAGLARRAGYHLVVLTSTVMPGDTDRQMLPVLESTSGKACGSDFGLCYSPEFIALGSVIRDYLHPDFLLIGEYDPRSGEQLSQIYRRVVANDPPIARMNMVNAELAKLSVNSYVTTRITFANMLLQICQSLPGADVDTITRAIGLDTRIGTKYLKGATAYGGPCFPRDNRAMAAVASSVGYEALLPRSVDRSNQQQTERLVTLIQQQVQPPAKVGVLGLSYKPQTEIIEESAGVVLVRALQQAGYSVLVHDPAAVRDTVEDVLADRVVMMALPPLVDEAELLVVMTPWSDYHQLVDLSLAGKTIIDCWRMLDTSTLPEGVCYIPLGRGRQAD